MTATAADWRPHVNAGDTLRVSTTYDAVHASWYEVMGIMVTWEAWDNQKGLDPFTGRVSAPRAKQSGIDPFARAVDEKGYLTHGRLPENRHAGGGPWLTVNPKKLPSCQTSTVDISNFTYRAGDLSSRSCIPTIKEGQSVSFVNQDASPLAAGIPGLSPSSAYLNSIFHTVTGCRFPCTADTGIAYPLANGPVTFSSGELGDGSPATGSVSWKTPTNLPPGTYTYFCYVHPFMRGAFRITR
jgi:plastocyanin